MLPSIVDHSEKRLILAKARQGKWDYSTLVLELIVTLVQKLESRREFFRSSIWSLWALARQPLELFKPNETRDEIINGKRPTNWSSSNASKESWVLFAAAQCNVESQLILLIEFKETIDYTEEFYDLVRATVYEKPQLGIELKDSTALVTIDLRTISFVNWDDHSQ